MNSFFSCGGSLHVIVRLVNQQAEQQMSFLLQMHGQLKSTALACHFATITRRGEAE